MWKKLKYQSVGKLANQTDTFFWPKTEEPRTFVNLFAANTWIQFALPGCRLCVSFFNHFGNRPPKSQTESIKIKLKRMKTDERNKTAKSHKTNKTFSGSGDINRTARHRQFVLSIFNKASQPAATTTIAQHPTSQQTTKAPRVLSRRARTPNPPSHPTQPPTGHPLEPPSSTQHHPHILGHPFFEGSASIRIRNRKKK